MRPTEAALAILGEHNTVLAVDVDQRKWALGRCTAAFGAQMLCEIAADAPVGM